MNGSYSDDSMTSHESGSSLPWDAECPGAPLLKQDDFPSSHPPPLSDDELFGLDDVNEKDWNHTRVERPELKKQVHTYALPTML